MYIAGGEGKREGGGVEIDAKDPNPSPILIRTGEDCILVRKSFLLGKMRIKID